MHAQQLETFIQVAKYGSFSQAASALYITPSAVIQQINNLEKSLQVSLFHRTKKGVTLTPAGEFLLTESQALIEKTRQITKGLARFRSEELNSITVGTSLLQKCRVFAPIWKAFRQEYPSCHFSIQAAINPSDVDLIECVQDGQFWQKSMHFLPLCQTPLACAVPPDHPLSGKDLLTIEDLRTTTLVTIKGGLSAQFGRFVREMQQEGVTVIEVAQYDLSTFSLCQTNGYLLQIPYIWKDLYLNMKTIPCAWDYALPYGFFYRKNTLSPVQEYIQFADAWTKNNPLLLQKILLESPK